MTSLHSALNCVKIIENKTLTTDIKIKSLTNILNENPASILHIVPLSNGTCIGGISGSLLHAAVCSSNFNVVKLLINYGADVNVKNQFGYSPLFAACSMTVQEISSNCLKLIKLLIDSGADVNAYGGSTWHTPLTYAVEFRHSTTIIDLLLYYGAKVSNDCLQQSLMYLNPNGAKILIRELLLENPNVEKPSFLGQFKKSSKYWDELQLQIDAELNLMKATKLSDSSISIYDLFVADERKLACYARNDELKKLNSNEYKKLFPNSIHRLKWQHQKGIERMIAENEAYIVMDHWQPPLFNHCVRQRIFEYLEIKDLKNLKEANAL